MKRKGMPARSAMPATVRLAEAPISVPLPPRQAPSESDHHSGRRPLRPAEGRRHALDHGDHGGDEGDVVDDGGEDRGGPQDHQGGRGEAAAGGAQYLFGEPVQKAGMLDAGDDGEQADEEEDGDPLDLGEHAVEAVGLLLRGAAEIVQQQQERRARQRDAAGLEADRAGQDEGEDDQADDEQGLAQQRPDR